MRFSALIFLSLLATSMLPACSTKSMAYEKSNWTRVGAIHLQPSSPQNPFQFYRTYYDPLNSWWNLNFSVFASQKYFDEMMLNRALSDHPSKSLAIHFPQFLADVNVFGTKYLEELEEVITFFYEKRFHILLFLGRPDYNAHGFMDSIRNSTARTYLQNNIDRIIRYENISDYVREVTLYWMGAVTQHYYTSEEVSEYNRQIKNLVNAAGDLFLVHVDGTWFEDNLTSNGYTPQSVSPLFGCSDGLLAESWSQGLLPNGLNKLIPKYFNSSQINMVCDVPNGYLNPVRPNSHSTVKEDMNWWFECIESFGITSWYMWDYYNVEADVPSTYSLIHPNATTLTKKGQYVRTITQTGLSYRDVAMTEAKLYRTVISQGSRAYINTTFLNQGDSAETFNFTVSANSAVIFVQNLALASGDSTIINFLWNVTLPLGNYTVRAETLLDNDTDASDNAFIWDPIKIAIPGDINADGKVNILDISTAAVAYGSKLGDQKWNFNADLDESQLINIIDISMIAKEFGKTV